MRRIWSALGAAFSRWKADAHTVSHGGQAAEGGRSGQRARLVRWRSRARCLLRRGRMEQDMEGEFRVHVELETQENLRQGMGPQDARRRALLAFGGVERYKEQGRGAHGTRWLEDLTGDVRYALRQLRRSRGFAAVAVVTLALGIGANTAIFSAVNAVLLEPLEYRDADRLLYVFSRVPGWGSEQYPLSPAEYRELQQLSGSFSEIGAWHTGSVNLSGIGSPVRVTSATATAELFTALGVPAQLGRTFTREEASTEDPVAIISSRLWQGPFARDPAVIGRQIMLDGEASTVVGVMPEGFDVEDSGVDVWIPAGVPEHPSTRGAHFLSVVGRLAPGVTLEQARSELEVVLDHWGEVAQGLHAPNDSTHRLGFQGLRDHMVADVRTPLLILLGAVSFVLLIACANVANLLFARAEGRQQEIAMRTALGAGRRRLIRQFLTESAVLAAIGGAVGLFLGHWGLSLLLATSPGSIPRAGSIGLDLPVLLFTLVVTLLTSLLFGLAPLAHVRRSATGAALGEDARRSSASASRLRLRRLLVVAQVALAVVLIVGAGLLLRSLGALYRVDPGFDVEELLTFELSLPETAYPEGSDRTAFLHRLTSRLEAIPGVESATTMSGLPLARDGNEIEIGIEGKQEQPGGPNHSVDYLEFVTSDYFETLGGRIVAGRAFNEGDDAEGTPVAIINETFARVFYPGENPIGQRIRMPWDSSPWFTIVGVAEDMKQGGLDMEIGTEWYFPYAQGAMLGFGRRTMNVAVRSAVPPLSLADDARRAVRALDPALPIAHLQTMQVTQAQSVSRPRFLALLLSIFAAVGLALAAVGTYGVLSYSVARRSKEIGIRMALGAEAAGVRRMVLRDGLAVAGLGLGFGLLGALGLTRLLSSLLFGISSTDPITYAGALALLAAVALAACYLPARRATRVDPLVALRCE